MNLSFLASFLALVSALIVAAPALAAEVEVREADLKSDRYIDVARDFAKDDPLRDLAQSLNETLKLPRPLGLRYAECGEPNAYYDPQAQEISLCFELIEGLAETLGTQLDDEDELANAVAGAYMFVALHEVGHALVHLLELPITGREEDAVDQLSAWLLIGEDGGDDAVLSAAVSFGLEGEGAEVGDGDFADEHSLNQQRYFNMVCWVYGSNPKQYADLLQDAGLPEARAERCAEEYAQIDRSWTALLEAHLRE